MERCRSQSLPSRVSNLEVNLPMEISGDSSGFQGFGHPSKDISSRERETASNINARARRCHNLERASVDNEAREKSGRDFDSSRPSLGYLAVTLVTRVIFGTFWRYTLFSVYFRYPFNSYTSISSLCLLRSLCSCSLFLQCTSSVLTSNIHQHPDAVQKP